MSTKPTRLTALCDCEYEAKCVFRGDMSELGQEASVSPIFCRFRVHGYGLSGGCDARFPFDRLPVELLQEIFFWCLIPSFPRDAEHIYHSIDLQGFNPRTAPLLLCQVCQLWRQVALSFPTLWASLNVYVSMGKARPPLAMASLWLGRSGAMPLSLSLFQQNESNDNCLVAEEILNLYKTYTHRWCDIQFDFTNPRYSRALTWQQRSAPMLKRFQMQTSYQVFEEDENDLFGIFSAVPCLSSLHLSRIPGLGWAGDGIIPIPWNQLVSLSLDYVPSVGTTLRILNKCPHLAECIFKIDSVDGSLVIEPVYSKLSCLNINISHDQLATFLNCLTLPAVEQLTIYVRGPLDPYGWPQAHFESFLKRSESKILHLEIHDTGMRFEEFAACLRNSYLQSLEKIVVDDRRDWTWNPFVTNLTMDLLTRSSWLDEVRRHPPGRDSLLHHVLETGVKEVKPDCLLPNLEQLVFRGSCLWTTDGTIADMVESRWRFHCCEAVRKLRRVELELPSSHVEDCRRLKEFSNEGLYLNLLFR